MNLTTLNAVFLDSATLGDDLSLQPLLNVVPHLRVYPRTSANEVLERVRDAEIIISNKVLLDRSAIEAARSLKLIVVAATGTNNVDLRAANKHGVTVCNAQNYATESVAHHALTLMLMMATQAHRYATDVQQGLWSAQDQFCLLHHPIGSLSGKTLGIVGAGHSGQRLAALAAALGMQTQFAQLPGRPSAPDKRPFRELLGNCDVLSLHCPLTDLTRHLINADSLAQLKAGALLINVARGGLIDDQALIAALRSGHLGGAALDVLSEEPPPPTHPLLCANLPNLLITPHIAWASLAARQQLITQLADNIVAFCAGSPRRVVNPAD